MNTTAHSITLIAKVLGWTLLHSLWQGLLMAAALFIVLNMLRNAGSKIRYYLSAAFLGLSFVLFLNTLITQWQKLQTSTVYITESVQGASSGHSYQVSTTAPDTGGTWTHYIAVASPRLEYYFPLLTAIYMLGLILMMSRFGINILQLKKLRSGGLTAVDHSWDEWINNYCRQFSIPQPVQVFFSERVNVPMVMGTLKPIILLPFTSLSHLSAEQLETILLHELAHIKRHDYLFNIFQNVVETFLFFNPFMWWISSIVRREREHCCDDMVIANTSHPLSYAKALAALENSRLQATYSMAVAATGQKNQLFNRIKRIMEMKKKSLNYSQLTVAVLIVGALVLTMLCFSPGFAQTNSKKDKTKQESSTTITHQKIIVIDNNGNKKEYNSVEELPVEQKEKLKKELDGDHTNTKTVVTTVTNTDDSDADLSNTINVAITNAMSNINMDSIGKTVEHALKQVDWNAVNKTLTMSFDKLDTNVDWKEIQKGVEMSMEEAKKALIEKGVATKEMEKAKKEVAIAMEKAKKEVKESMANANVSEMAAARQTKDHSYERMIRKMEADGLIDRADGFKVVKKDNELYINDERQPEEIFNKYEQYLQDEKVVIKGKNDGLTIDIHN